MPYLIILKEPLGDTMQIEVPELECREEHVESEYLPFFIPLTNIDSIIVKPE